MSKGDYKSVLIKPSQHNSAVFRSSWTILLFTLSWLRLKQTGHLFLTLSQSKEGGIYLLPYCKWAICSQKDKKEKCKDIISNEVLKKKKMKTTLKVRSPLIVGTGRRHFSRYGYYNVFTLSLDLVYRPTYLCVRAIYNNYIIWKPLKGMNKITPGS